MRDARRELADRRELLRLQQLHVRFLEPPDQAALLVLLVLEARLRGLALVDLLLHFPARALQHVRRALVLPQRALELARALRDEFLERIGHPAQERGARIEARDDERRAQDRHGKEGDRRAEPRAADLARRAAYGVRPEMRGRHARVVHAGDREPHHARRGDPLHEHARLVLVAQAVRDPQRGRRRADRDRDRCDEQREVIGDRGLHPQRAHPGVMHARDAEPHQHAADREPLARERGARDRVQREVRHDHRDRERRERVAEIVAERDRQREREHADEVHRPDARAHRGRAAREPRAAHPGLVEERDERAQVERRV
ncbi:hypothetical protein BURPSS13_I0393 [Burkholderia pseudomallei S13]|nr:hypothetical protein BURPSS13_I0393 [Burkholderia pseudomallei S13]